MDNRCVWCGATGAAARGRQAEITDDDRAGMKRAEDLVAAIGAAGIAMRDFEALGPPLRFPNHRLRAAVRRELRFRVEGGQAASRLLDGEIRAASARCRQGRGAADASCAARERVRL